VNIILKVDTKGSLEAILGALKNIKSEEVALNILKAEIGNISESDIKTARAVQAEIIGFNVSVDSFLQKLAVSEEVEIKNYDVIYKLIDEIKKSTSELLEPEIIRQDLGTLEVIAVFKTGKFNPSHQMKMIVGAKVLSGKITKESLLDIYRNEEKIGQGKISELQLEKNKVEEIKEGQNAGIDFKGDVKIELKDKLEAYLVEEKKREL
jgi:translation initiation factor IF-2